MWLLELASVYWQQGNITVKELNASSRLLMHPYSILISALLNDYFWTILALIASWVQLLEI